MTDNINPSHYKDGPFECIELSRLLSSDWGQAVQYCFRWQHKNGVEDLKKALWFINDAITHNVPFFAACCKRNADILEAQAIRLLSILQAENWLISNSSGGTSSGETAWTCSKPSPKRSMKSKRKESNHGTYRAVRHRH